MNMIMGCNDIIFVFMTNCGRARPVQLRPIQLRIQKKEKGVPIYNYIEREVQV